DCRPGANASGRAPPRPPHPRAQSRTRRSPGAPLPPLLLPQGFGRYAPRVPTRCARIFVGISVLRQVSPSSATEAFAVEAVDLVKDFGDTRAVDGVSLAVPAGSIY